MISLLLDILLGSIITLGIVIVWAVIVAIVTSVGQQRRAPHG